MAAQRGTCLATMDSSCRSSGLERSALLQVRGKPGGPSGREGFAHGANS